MFGIKKNAKKELERLKKSEWSEASAQKILQNEKRLDKITLAPALKECADDVKLFFAMLRDFVTKKYPYLRLHCRGRSVGLPFGAAGLFAGLSSGAGPC